MNIEDQLRYLQQELKNVEAMLQEQIKDKELNEQLLKDVDELNNMKEDDELIVPISKGIFVRLKLKEFNGFVVNVGNNVLVDKDIDGIKKLLQDNIKILDENINVLKQQEQKLLELIDQLVNEMNKSNKNQN